MRQLAMMWTDYHTDKLSASPLRLHRYIIQLFKHFTNLSEPKLQKLKLSCQAGSPAQSMSHRGAHLPHAKAVQYFSLCWIYIYAHPSTDFAYTNTSCIM